MDSKVKQRLVGSLVLIGFVILLLPIIFHSGNVSTENISMSPQAKAAPPKPSLQAVVAKQAEALEVKRQALQKNTQQFQIGAPVINHTSQLKPNNWWLQIASFKNKTHAIDLQKRLSKKDLKTTIRFVKTKGTDMSYFQVIAGPYKQKQQAQALLKVLKTQVGLQGLLIASK